MTLKKAIDQSGLDKQSREFSAETDKKNKVMQSGVSGDNLPEGVPRYLSSKCEKVISGRNNAWVVLGRDRSGSRISGYGGKGDTHAGSVDIVAGRLGYLSKKVNENNEQMYADPDFKRDAARIYLSQKADIDKYFDLAQGSGNAKTKSAIAIKADAVRIIAREGIKLVTGTDVRNSQGGELSSVVGIDLIAGNNDEDLQNIPKGKNLVEALDRMVHHLDASAGIVDALLMTCMEMNKALVAHFHNSPYFGQPTTPSAVVMSKGTKVLINQLTKVKTSLVAHKKNLASFKVTYLNPAGEKYINSRHNKTN